MISKLVSNFTMQTSAASNSATVKQKALAWTYSRHLDSPSDLSRSRSSQNPHPHSGFLEITKTPPPLWVFRDHKTPTATLGFRALGNATCFAHHMHGAGVRVLRFCVL